MKRRMFLLGCPALITACAIRRGPPLPGTLQDVDALTRALTTMGPGVDIYEARAAARLAYAETHRLALQYQIVDPPLVHNAKVNAGYKPRGLCWHWAEDLEARLKQQGFRTLRMHRAIANADNAVRIDHSTAVISAAGAPMKAGIVLDPWREGGELYWARVSDDTYYDWEERGEVMRRHGRARYAKQGANVS